MKYSVSRQGETQGPFAIEEIVAKVRAKELELFDYVFDEQRNDWVLLMEFPLLADKLKSSKPPRPGAPVETPARSSDSEVQTVTATVTTIHKAGKSADAHGINEWYVLKGENRFGPFSYNDVVRMMQQKVVFPFDYVWHTGMANWQRMVEFEEFKPETIRALFQKAPKSAKEVFSERKFKRKPFDGEVIVHDNMSVWRAQAVEISRGGVGVSMKNTVVVPGQNVIVHFRQHGDLPAFNAVCEVVSKKFVSDDSPVQYGLRFLNLTQEVQNELNKKVA